MMMQTATKVIVTDDTLTAELHDGADYISAAGLVSAAG